MEMNKENRLYRELHHELEKHESKQFEESSQSTSESVCPKCGAHVERDMKFCEECGNPLGVCPHCHKQIDSDLALCPYCGNPIHLEQCTFCNAYLDEDDKFCPECGNSRKGIVCPECKTLNFRSFCRNCNTPLNEMAHKMVKEVMNDSRVIEARSLAERMTELEQTISQLVQEIDGTDNENESSVSEGFSEADRDILNEYNELFNSITTFAPSVQPRKLIVPDSKTGKITQGQRQKLRTAVDEYRSNVKKMQSIFDTMLPDPKDPPEMQRNFLCACKVATYSNQKTKSLETVGWICNYCGCRHRQPSECTRPELGGKWLVKEVEIITKVTKTSTIYL